jgi:hypothetical protein
MSSGKKLSKGKTLGRIKPLSKVKGPGSNVVPRLPNLRRP